MPHSHSPLARRGLLFVLSSPSGAGKTTLARRLLAEDGDINMSVSTTTRAPRPGEVNGHDYDFVDVATFEKMVEHNDFIEWAHVFGHRYGTPREQIERGVEEGQDFLFDIDWQGTQQLYQQLGRDVVRVFILPPSIEALEARLRSRGTDSDDIIDGRMDRARDEISHWDAYDYVLVNDDIDVCFAEVRAILVAERLKRRRQTGIIEFARKLVHGS